MSAVSMPKSQHFPLPHKTWNATALFSNSNKGKPASLTEFFSWDTEYPQHCCCMENHQVPVSKLLSDWHGASLTPRSSTFALLSIRPGTAPCLSGVVTDTTKHIHLHGTDRALLLFALCLAVQADL